MRQKGANCNKKTVWEGVLERQRENKRASVISTGGNGSVKEEEGEQDNRNGRINQRTFLHLSNCVTVRFVQ